MTPTSAGGHVEIEMDRQWCVDSGSGDFDAPATLDLADDHKADRMRLVARGCPTRAIGLGVG